MKNIALVLALTSVLALTGCNGIGLVNHAVDGTIMSMDDMSTILKDKTGDAFDKAFIQTMIPHHEGAIMMAKQAQKFAKHKEIHDMAQDIIDSQQKEIDQMKKWAKMWGYLQEEPQKQ